jgi:hypothetical protein
MPQSFCVNARKRRAGTGLTAAAPANAKGGGAHSPARSGAARKLVLFILLGTLGACATPLTYTAKPVRFQPPGGSAAWEITGRLDTSDPDSGDAAVTIWINGQFAAVGGFQVHDGIADGSFTGAYSGRKIAVHCTNVAPPSKGFLCDIGDGAIPAGTLAFPGAD